MTSSRNMPHVRLSVSAHETIAAATARALPNEAGGVLLGYRTDSNFVVTEVLQVRGHATTTSFVRDDVEANRLLTEFLKDRDPSDPVGYIGEWHSHPAPVGASPRDLESIRATARAHPEPLILLIYSAGTPWTYSGRIAQRRFLFAPRIATADVSYPPTRFPPLGPLPERAVRGDGPVFISYRQSDGTKLADSFEELARAAGLVVWRDHTDLRGGTTTDRLERALTHGLSGAVLIVTPDIADSEIVRERELPRLLELDRADDFSMCIANAVPRAIGSLKCDYAAPDRLLRLAPAQPLADKKQANVLRSSGQLDIIRDLVMHRVEERKPIITRDGRAFTIKIQSRPATFAIDAGAEDLHIRVRAPESGRLPPAKGLKLLKKTLGLVGDAVHASGAQKVKISGGAHLSVAIALGAALPSTEFNEIEVVDSYEQIWNSSRANAENLPEIRTETLQRSDSPSAVSRVAVFITLSPDPDRAAFQSLIERGPGFDVALALSAGDGRIDPSSAGAFSEALAAKILDVASTFGRSEVHLAYHGPYGLGVLIGRRLNTLRTVVYEWTGELSNQERYVPVMTLEPGAGDGPIVAVHSTSRARL
ncbi:SAVED domain-containing protein [Microbacterium sp. MYb66]|uniref:SAVED domain-containing protein n=1 Tax=Microbacterium sp. MYb66 TaxID=1848692 RepID=UPI001C611A6F|nr:SAVED domain-containing protein [Microbacterium sp. MYb66]